MENNDFRLILQGILDESATAQKIKSQLPSLQSKIQNEYKLKFGIELEDSIAKTEAKKMAKQLQSQVQSELKNTKVDIGLDLKKVNVKSNIDQFLSTNTRLTGALRDEFLRLKVAVDSVDDGKSLANIKTQLSTLKNEAKSLGMVGLAPLDQLKQNLGAFSNWFGIGTIVAGSVRKVINSFRELKEIDTILTEISKTSDRTAESIERLGNASFDTASQFGQKASDYLSGVQEMSRAGFGEKQSEDLASLSTLAQSAGDMTADLANQYIIASDAAYEYGGNVEKLSALLDSQNKVTNKNAVNMTDLAEATKIAASQAYQSGVSEKDLTAVLSTMIATTQQGGDIAARAFKGILMNLQQVSGELDGEEFNEESFKKVEKRLDSVGVAMEEVKNGAASLRDPIKVLGELAEVYNSLPDDSADKAGIIADLGGKYRGGQLAALLSGWSTYEKILGDYDNAQGSALEEAKKTAESWDGLTNSIENNWSEFVNIFVTDDSTTSILKFVKDLTGGFNDLTKSIGSIGTVGAVAGGIFGAKTNLDKQRLYSANACFVQ